MKTTYGGLFCAAIAFALCAQLAVSAKDIVYLTPGLDLPFWRYLSKGIESLAQKEGYGYQAFDSHNDAQTQLKNAQDAIAAVSPGSLSRRQTARLARASWRSPKRQISRS